MIAASTLALLLPDYLLRQRWFGAGSAHVQDVHVVAHEVWRDEWPGLVWALADVHLDDGRTTRVQVMVGLRSVEQYEHFLDGKGRALLGDVATSQGEALAYDALTDPELVLHILERVAPGCVGSYVRPVTVEQSNSSVVIDDRYILKVFRQPQVGPNPDREVPQRLWATGFRSLPEPVAAWGRDGTDLAVVRGFVTGATDGFALAQTSLRDLCASRVAPADAGGDFAPDAARLGEVTGALHVSLAAAYGATPLDAGLLARDLTAEVDRVEVPGFDRADLHRAVGCIAGPGSWGCATRVHGDFHLGQVLRADAGWFVLDFEGEPLRPLAERVVPTSPLRDVAGLLRSLHYAAAVVVRERDGGERDEQLHALARAWEERSRQAFLAGYRSVPGVAALCPSDARDWSRLLRAFLVAKAVYEVGYEQRYRPGWEAIPLRGLQATLAWEP